MNDWTLMTMILMGDDVGPSVLWIDDAREGREGGVWEGTKW